MTTKASLVKHTILLLERADEELTRNGWCQGHYYNGLEQHCTIGALRAVQDANLAPITRVNCEALATQTIRNLIADSAPCGCGNCDLTYVARSTVIEWNDDRARTQEDVHLMFKRAIEELSSS